jgi:carboxymethylenebutenolidase
MGQMIEAGYLAKPEGAGNGKGIIVIQEWWGLVPHIQDVADRFAALGYLALAPDLWDGKKTTSADEAGRLFMALNIEDASKKMRAAAEALAAHGATGKVGIIGFCMGGILALHAAGANPDLIGPAANFYGVHPNVHPSYETMSGPVLIVAGEHDTFVTPETAREIQAKVQAAGRQAELHIYPAGHAFFNDARPEAYHAASAADVWEKTKAFFAANL